MNEKELLEIVRERHAGEGSHRVFFNRVNGSEVSVYSFVPWLPGTRFEGIIMHSQWPAFCVGLEKSGFQVIELYNPPGTALISSLNSLALADWIEAGMNAPVYLYDAGNVWRLNAEQVIKRKEVQE